MRTQGSINAYTGVNQCVHRGQSMRIQGSINAYTGVKVCQGQLNGLSSLKYTGKRFVSIIICAPDTNRVQLNLLVIYQQG